MSTGDILLVAAIVLLAIGFALLIVVLIRVLDVTNHLRREVTDLRDETRMLVDDLRISTDEARESVDEARHDLERFDKVLGSAEAIGDAVGSTVARSAFSSPAIKAAGLARGASRTMARLRRKPGPGTHDNVIDVQRAAGALPSESKRRRA
jgi:hypothetical protein